MDMLLLLGAENCYKLFLEPEAYIAPHDGPNYSQRNVINLIMLSLVHVERSFSSITSSSGNSYLVQSLFKEVLFSL